MVLIIFEIVIIE